MPAGTHTSADSRMGEVISPVSSSSPNWYGVSKKSLAIADDNLLEVAVRSRVHCSFVCLSMEECKTAIYDADSGICAVSV